MARTAHWAGGYEVVDAVAEALNLDAPISAVVIRAHVRGTCEIDVTFVLEESQSKELAERLEGLPLCPPSTAS